MISAKRWASASCSGVKTMSFTVCFSMLNRVAFCSFRAGDRQASKNLPTFQLLTLPAT